MSSHIFATDVEWRGGGGNGGWKRGNMGEAMHVPRAVPGEEVKVTSTGLSLVPFSRAHTDIT